MPRNANRQRQLIANEAARIVIEQSLRDLHAAKLKAAERLGLSGRGALPRNVDIEEAIRSHQALFGGNDHRQLLRTLRDAALEGVRFFSEFHARLVGPVLAGTANSNSPVNLHLFADTPEAVALFLEREGVPYDQGERRLRVTREDHRSYPLFRFMAGDVAIEATVFPLHARRQAPLSPVDGRPMERADEAAIRSLQLTA